MKIQLTSDDAPLGKFILSLDNEDFNNKNFVDLTLEFVPGKHNEVDKPWDKSATVNINELYNAVVCMKNDSAD